MHLKGVFNYHNTDFRPNGCFANAEKIPLVTEPFSFSSDFKPIQQLKAANYLNHAIFLQKTMELFVEKSGDSYLTDPEIIGIPINVKNTYNRSANYFRDNTTLSNKRIFFFCQFV